MKILVLAVWILLLMNFHVDAQTPYFQGKTIRIVTGYPAGDVNDLWPRLIAQYMARYIPGSPNFVVQNMTGASSMIAANYVYSVAKPDALTLGWVAPTLYFDQLVGRKEVQYDWGKYSFIGSPAESEHHLLCARTVLTKPLKTSAKRVSRPSAVPAAPAARDFSSLGCSRKPWARSSPLCLAIRAAGPSTSRSRRARSIAEP